MAQCTDLEKIMRDLTYLNHFSFHEVQYDTYHESSFPMPARYNFLMYLQKGTAHITSDNKTIVLNAGEVLHIPRGAKYSVKMYGTPHILFGSYAYLNYQENGGKTYAMQKISCTAYMLDLIGKVSGIDGVNCESLGYFYLFMHELYKILTPTHNDGKQDVLERAINFIIRKPDCKVGEVATHCHISESALYALFSERAQVTPARFKLLVRLERAVNYLISTDIPIEEISDLCGFSSSSYFRKNLYKIYQKTPSQIRKNSDTQILGF